MSMRKHFSVNWIDGMKISKAHFQEMDDFQREQLALITQAGLSDYQYGLIGTDSIGEALDIVVTSERVEVVSCRAITRSGYYIEVNSKNNLYLRRSISDLMGERSFAASSGWLIVLRLLLEESISLGVPDPDEHPLRAPYREPKIELEIIPDDQFTSEGVYAHAIPLARIVNDYRGVEKQDGYIPPLMSLSADRQLLQFYGSWNEAMLEIDGYLYEIIKKVHAKNRSNQGNQLSSDILPLTAGITKYISENFDYYRTVLPQRPPVETVLWFMALARTVKNSMRLATNKDNLLKYFDFYISGEPTALESSATQVCNHDFSQIDIQQSVIHISHFVGVMKRLFGELVTLDLHQLLDPTIIFSTNMSPTANPSFPPPGRSNTGGSITIKPKSHGSGPSSPTGGNDGGGGWNISD